MTLRYGAGASKSPFDAFNLGAHVPDEAHSVAANRRELASLLALPASPGPIWLEQVHGGEVVMLDRWAGGKEPTPVADAAVARGVGPVCALLTADCLPVLLCEQSGAVIGAAHAGWRGLACGVIEATVRAMEVPPERLTAWLGPCISGRAFEVGPEVREAFLEHDDGAASAFRAGQADGWFADLQQLARQRLLALGLDRHQVYFDGACTYEEPKRFFSYRRDGVCGRMATLIWRTHEPTN